jgi:hypothetical protein
MWFAKQKLSRSKRRSAAKAKNQLKGKSPKHADVKQRAKPKQHPKPKHHAKPKQHPKPKHHAKPKPKPQQPAHAEPSPLLAPPPPTKTEVAQTPAAQPPPVITPAPTPPPAGTPAPPVPSPPTPPAGTAISSPVAMYSGTFGTAQANRLLWRAGFGPRPGDAEHLASLGLQAAVCSLTRPAGPATLVGPAPYHKDGSPLDPVHVYSDDQLYWVDRMVRSDQQLVERLALNFHDWFSTNENDIPQILMLNQTNVFRAHGLGSFADIVNAMVSDPALILFLSGVKNVAWAVNENFARELQELFALGANNGYTQSDVTNVARALTGWRYVEGPGGESDMQNFHVDVKCHDWTNKTVYGQTGNWDWSDIARMVVHHPDHPRFFVSKLWSYFISTGPSASDLETLASTYASSGFQIRPVVEAILCHPDFYNDVNMVKPPVVYVAGMLRARQLFVDGETWQWNCTISGQTLYQPPDVGGWDYDSWLNSNTMLGRWQTVYLVTAHDAYDGQHWASYDATETAQQALTSALSYWNNPSLRPDAQSALLTFANAYVPAQADPVSRAQRQNALRHLIGISPDYQVC